MGCDLEMLGPAWHLLLPIGSARYADSGRGGGGGSFMEERPR